MSGADEISVQSVEGSNPTLVIVPIKAYRRLILWTDHDESELDFPPQIIRSPAGLESHVVLLEEDFLTLKNTWQVSEDQKFFLTKGTEKGASARALYFPDSNRMLVLKGATMADSEAPVDFSEYSAIRRRLKINPFTPVLNRREPPDLAGQGSAADPDLKLALNVRGGRLKPGKAYLGDNFS